MGSNLNPFQEIDDFVGLGKPEEPLKPPKIEIDNLLDDDIDNLVDSPPVNQNNDDIHNLLDSGDEEEQQIFLKKKTLNHSKTNPAEIYLHTTPKLLPVLTIDEESKNSSPEANNIKIDKLSPRPKNLRIKV